MWGNGGRLYWGRRERGGTRGIVVLFAWLSSEERNLRPYVDLYGSLGWNSLVCHVDFLTLFFPQKATSLAFEVLNELVEEVNIRPLPIVLTSFSGGSKGCLYKVLQLIEGKCEGQHNKDEFQLVRDCICGQVYDSSPVDFTSNLGTRFVLHPSVLKISHPPRVVSWMARGLASGLDTLFLRRFEAQRAEYWQTLYSSVGMGPFLILSSEDDELAPYQIVCNFAQRLQELGGDVKLVKWNTSPHVGVSFDSCKLETTAFQCDSHYDSHIIHMAGKGGKINKKEPNCLVLFLGKYFKTHEKKIIKHTVSYPNFKAR